MFESMNIDWSFLWDHKTPSLERQFTDWLYGDWDEAKYKDYNFLNQLPVVNQYMDYLLDIRSDREYLTRYGMDYTDIHDPRKLKQTSGASRLYSAGFNMISKNVSKLYD